MIDQKKKRRAGFYWKQEGNDETPYISVTEILKNTIPKPQLQYWFGQQVYYAVSKDPAIDEKTALYSPFATAKTAANRGSIIHSIIEARQQSGAIVSPMDEELRGYATSFNQWIEVTRPEFLGKEKTVFLEKLRVAGTLDAIVKVNGKNYVVDFKTNKEGTIYPEAHLQVSAYIEALKNSEEKIEGGLLVGLSKDGNYTMESCRDGYETFKHCFHLYTFLQEEKLNKIGWFNPTKGNV